MVFKTDQWTNLHSVTRLSNSKPMFFVLLEVASSMSCGFYTVSHLCPCSNLFKSHKDVGYWYEFSYEAPYDQRNEIILAIK